MKVQYLLAGSTNYPKLGIVGFRIEVAVAESMESRQVVLVEYVDDEPSEAIRGFRVHWRNSTFLYLGITIQKWKDTILYLVAVGSTRELCAGRRKL